MNLSTKPPQCWTAAVNSSNSSFCSVRINSGSSRSLSAVKPLRSANNTVTVRRSASVSGLAGWGARSGSRWRPLAGKHDQRRLRSSAGSAHRPECRIVGKTRNPGRKDNRSRCKDTAASFRIWGRRQSRSGLRNRSYRSSSITSRQGPRRRDLPSSLMALVGENGPATADRQAASTRSRRVGGEPSCRTIGSSPPRRRRRRRAVAGR